MSFTARRFPDTIVRRRQAPGSFDDDGVFTPGAMVDTELRASVQPVALIDEALAEGVRLSDKLRVFVRDAPALALEPNNLMWGGDALMWGNDRLTFGQRAVQSDDHGPALIAAFDDRDADRVMVDGAMFKVIESMAWSNHTMALLLRES